VPTVMVVPTEERKRVTTLFKQFCDVGSSKVPLALIPKVVKATLQPTHAPEGAYKRIQALAKEVLPAKCGASGAVALGEFITWYFDYAWPELTASEGAKPPDRKSRAGGGSRTTAADAAGSSRVATADGGKGGGASSAAGLTADAGCGESGAPACAPTAAASQSDQVVDVGPPSKLAAARPPGVPPGWEIGSAIHVEELRRIQQLCATFQASAGSRGRVLSSQLQPLLELALKPAHEPEQLPLWTTQLLDQQAADELASDELGLGLDGASFTAKDRPVGVGKIVKFWFDHVWPTVSDQLLPVHHPQSDGQMQHRTGHRTQKKPG